MSSVNSVIQGINNAIIDPLILLLFGAALAFFLWGVFQFIANADSEEGRGDGRRHILWGIIGMVIMLGVYAILRIALATFNVPPPSNFP